MPPSLKSPTINVLDQDHTYLRVNALTMKAAIIPYLSMAPLELLTLKSMTITGKKNLAALFIGNSPYLMHVR